MILPETLCVNKCPPGVSRPARRISALHGERNSDILDSMESPFSLRAAELILSIPPGRVAAYGQIAALAGNPRGARQVARLLHSSSRTLGLPWHRVLGSSGRISLPFPASEEQRRMLEAEGVEFGAGERVDFTRYGFRPSPDGDPGDE